MTSNSVDEKEDPMSEVELVERLTDRLIGAVPSLGSGEQAVALALLRALAKGAPVCERALAAATGDPESTVRAALASWPGVFRDEGGRVVGFMGLSVVEFGEHRIELGGRTLTAWCAWDTLFLPELLGQTARVRSRCPVTGKAISLTVGPDGPSEVRPAGTVLSFLEPERPFDADVVRSFCHFVHFFASEQPAAEWTARHPGTFTLSLGQAFRLGRRTNRATFGSALGGADIAA
jgi:alkylmercury lyase